MKSVTYRIDTELNTIFTEYRGLIDVEDLIKQTKIIQTDPKFERNMNSLVDLSQARPSRNIDFNEVNRYREFIKSIEKTRGNCKWAIIAPDDLVFGLSRMFEMLSGNLTIQAKVFRSEPEALEWLEIGTASR